MSASPLRAWLKNEGLFDVDLETILDEQGIKDPETDFKSLTQSKWDEIVRLATVARAKDIKDNKARMRMEEKLTKIEAFWRQQSGVEKTTINADSAAAKSPKETKNKPLKSQEEEKDALSNASELKKWMQKEEIWEKDLFLVLTKNNVTCEDDLANINTQAAFDEIIREVTVLRRDDIKENAAKMRLEKLLAKFERFWRAKTGIEKTNINSNSKASKDTHDKNAPLKSQQDEKEALTNATELKKWMQKEEIWEKDLFLVLTQHSVTCEDDITKIDTQSAFDEIIREVTVLRRDDTKDKNAKMRLEKLLAKFEKLWRSKTGIEKTNIHSHSKAAQGDQNTKNTPLKSQEEEKDALSNAAELKKWMQKEEIWEKDLFLVLTKHNVKSEEELTIIDSEDGFAEIIREVTVLRRDETKDKNAKMRLEKLLAKFEKIWRAKTGIEKTNIKQGSDDKKGTQAPKDSENEKMATTGKSLKTWMQGNEIWEKALFDELLSNNIKEEDDLTSLSESQFDEITRKVRVDRFSNMKDQSARQRLDKLLISFERLWREKSGNQKSNIPKAKQ